MLDGKFTTSGCYFVGTHPHLYTSASLGVLDFYSQYTLGWGRPTAGWSDPGGWPIANCWTVLVVNFWPRWCPSFSATVTHCFARQPPRTILLSSCWPVLWLSALSKLAVQLARSPLYPTSTGLPSVFQPRFCSCCLVGIWMRELDLVSG